MKKQWMVVLCGLFLRMAEGWSQTQRLVFSQRVLRLSPERRDTVKIYNPNSQALIFDSLDAASSELTRGRMQMGNLRSNSARDEFAVDWGDAKATPETAYPFHTGKSSSAAINFPPGDTYYLGLKYYDPCPVCETQDMAAPADSLGLRLVFVRPGMTDTLFIRLDRRFTVSLGPRMRVRVSPAEGLKSDVLGRLPRGRAAGPVQFAIPRLP